MCFIKIKNKFSKRPGAMNKLTNVVHCGWMTKSPPEQKLQSPIKIFRARWRQRYFVLHKPSGSLPDQYELSYYNSEACSKKKGSIDLDQCEQIIESLDSDHYPYLLAIKTVARGKVRTYYLATETEEDMAAWVQCLCRVCGLKQEDSPTDIPDTRGNIQHNATGGAGSSQANSSTTVGRMQPSTTAASPTSGVISVQPSQALPARTSTTVSSSTSSSHSQPLLSASPQSYVLLNECITGPPAKGKDYERSQSIDSVPEYQAPPPPALPKKSHGLITPISGSKDSLHDSVFDPYDVPPQGFAALFENHDHSKGGLQELYDRPRSGEFSHDNVDDVYKVPPASSGGPVLLNPSGQSTSSDIDITSTVPLPFRRSPRPDGSSLSDRPESTDSFGRPLTENYDVPPSRPLSSSSKNEAGSLSTPPPERPPKPHGLQSVQNPYQNLPPSSSKSYGESGKPFGENNMGGLNAVPSAPSKAGATSLSYDVPRSSTVISPPRDSSVLEVALPAPAPRQCLPGKGPSYLNTFTQGRPGPADSYHNLVRRDGRGDHDDIPFLDSEPPPMPPSGTKPSSTSSERSFTELSGGEDVRMSSSSLYQVPPVAPRPDPRGQIRSATLPRPMASSAVGVDAVQQAVWSSKRTKSFKKNHQINASPKPGTRPPPLPAEPVPRRPPRRSPEFASSSDDDDDDSSFDGNNTHHELSIVRMSTVPNAPDILDTEPDLKYLDLDLDAPSDHHPHHHHHHHQPAAAHGTGTEYREIDFIKTKALQDTKVITKAMHDNKREVNSKALHDRRDMKK